MAHPREIKNRIHSIQNTAQITRAMKMVATAKLRRVLDKTIDLRPYARSVTSLKNLLLEEAPDLAKLYYGGDREETNIGILFFTGDRGLCGSFNVNLAKELDRFTASKSGCKFRIFSFGKKGKSFITKKQKLEGDKIELSGSMDDLINRIHYPVALELTRKALGAFMSGQIDAFYVVFSTYINAMSQKPHTVKLWPPVLTGTVEEEADKLERNYLFEPNARDLVKPIMERYVSISVFQAMLESASSEYAARMSAMENATRSAGDLIDALTLVYNKARQAKITDEILDIVGGAEALRAANQ